METFPIDHAALVVSQGDITKVEVQAVVNAANLQLASGGGVDGAIHRAAGPELLEAGQEIHRRQGDLPAGEAVVTPGFELPAQWVIHTVGPVHRGGGSGERETLASAYRRSLELACEQGIDTVAFPAISCGAYGYPEAEAADVAVQTLAQGLQDGLVQEARLVLHGRSTYEIFLSAARKHLGAAGK
jgi:O-acetyl-ADP-ribose deacetylase (regulator of RNase III)